jgi:transcriptional regulator with XRE-family HTH domain
MNSTNDKIKRMRMHKGFSQVELARRSGVSQPAISQIESGTKTPTLDTLRKLAKALGVPVSELID